MAATRGETVQLRLRQRAALRRASRRRGWGRAGLHQRRADQDDGEEQAEAGGGHGAMRATGTEGGLGTREVDGDVERGGRAEVGLYAAMRDGSAV